MSGVHLCKSKVHLRCALSVPISCTHSLFLLQNYPPLSFSLKYISTNTKKSENSFTVSYLVNTCGLSPESALSASKYLRLNSPDRADKIINFLEDHGCSKSQIAKLIRGFPILLACAYPEKTLLPKIEFFYSKGMSSTDLWKILSQKPRIFCRSLEHSIIPSFDFIKGLLRSDENVITAIKRYSAILTHNRQSFIEPNMAILQQYGVPMSSISYLLINQPRTFYKSPCRFKEVAEEVKLMGIKPLRLNFVVAISVKFSMCKSILESKQLAYKQWGLSDEEISSVFVRNARIMAYSEKKIMAAMDLLVNKMGWESSRIIRYPEVLGMSLEKRIIPRCSVIKVLWSKGLINKALAFHQVFYCSEKMFLQKFVICYEEEAPDLLKLYQEMVEHSK